MDGFFSLDYICLKRFFPKDGWKGKMVDGNWKDECLGTGWMDGMIGDRIQFFFNWTGLTCMECCFFCLNAPRGEASHMLCFAFLVQRFGSKTKKKGWVATESVCKMSDRPPFAQAWQQQQMRTPSGGMETIWWRPCNYCHAMYVWRFGCRNKNCATGSWVCIIFSSGWKGQVFFSSFTHPFFWGQW